MKAYVPRGPQSGTMHLRSARSQSPQSPQIWSAVNCAHTRGSASRSWLVSTATEVHILCKHAPQPEARLESRIDQRFKARRSEEPAKDHDPRRHDASRPSMMNIVWIAWASGRRATALPRQQQPRRTARRRHRAVPWT